MRKVHLLLPNIDENSKPFVINSLLLVNPSLMLTKIIDSSEGHELFIKSVHGSSSSSPATVAFVVESGRSSSSSCCGFSPRSGRGCRSGGRGRGHRPPHCQLYRQTGHYVNKCPDLYTFAYRGYYLDANLA
ncbi:hypothetical protein Tco_0973414 [Tanacetum coccineum]